MTTSATTIPYARDVGIQGRLVNLKQSAVASNEGTLLGYAAVRHVCLERGLTLVYT